MTLLFVCKPKHVAFTVWWATIIYKIVEVGCPTSVTLSIVLGTEEKGSGFPLGNHF
jgi:hypothetical protein